MSWLKRLGALAVASAAGLAVLAPAAGAAETGIYGFGLSSSATAISFIYDQPSFGLPAEHTFELRKVYTVTQLDSGPSGRGMASILWPGDVVGNAPLGLALDLFVQDPSSAHYLDCSGDPPLQTSGHICAPALDSWRVFLQTFKDDYKTYSGQDFNPPPYPIRAESFYPQGPEDAYYPAGAGVEMRSHAEEKLARAESKTQDAGFPGALTIGGMYSLSTSGVVKDQAVSEARTYVQDVDLFGELHIDSISSYIKATSDGTKSHLDSFLHVVGLTIHGNKITVDGSGFHACQPGGEGKPDDCQSQDPFGTYAKQYMDQYLAPNGVSLSVQDQPIDLRQGPEASRAISGVTISMDAAGMNTLLDAMPETPGNTIRSWIRNPTTDPFDDLGVPDQANPFNQLSSNVNGYLTSPFQFDQQMQIVLGSVFATSAASPNFEFPVPETPVIQFPEAPPGGGVVYPPVIGPAAQQPQQQPARIRQTFALRPVAVAGVSAGVAAAAVILALVGSFVLRRFADEAMSASEGSCSESD